MADSSRTRSASSSRYRRTASNRCAISSASVSVNGSEDHVHTAGEDDSARGRGRAAVSPFTADSGDKAATLL
jgi:hypothetical protein